MCISCSDRSVELAGHAVSMTNLYSEFSSLQAAVGVQLCEPTRLAWVNVSSARELCNQQPYVIAVWLVMQYFHACT